MIATTGFASLLLVLSISIFLPVFNLISFKRNSLLSLERITKTLLALIFCSAVTAQIALIISYINCDFSLLNVYQNSHHLKPLIYKISGSWGNHEGSMLLLISVLCGYSAAFVLFSKIESKRKIIIASTQSLIIAAFAAFTAFTSNPFAPIFPIPAEGLGLNPLLQDIGLAMHPPMLYIGYVGFSLVFSFAIAGLLCEKIDRDFAAYLKNWLFFTYGFLTLGIGLGSWWAYRELGWGGYWFWDPVENVSLMPWIAATALIHCVKFLEKKNLFKKWSAFLAIVTFILCLLGIFLTRSGVLTSVHSFAVDAKRGFFVILLIAVIGGISLLIFGAKAHKLSQTNNNFYFWSKAGAVLVNNYFLILSLFIVVLGTLYPLFSQSFFDQFISIGPDYYNKLFSILLLPFLIFLGLSCLLNYSEKTAAQKIVNRFSVVICLLAIALTSLTLFYQKSADFLQIIILFSAIFAALLTFSFLLKIIWRDKKYDLLISHAPMTAAHLGFALIIIGIVLTSSFGLTKEINIKENEVIKIADYEIKLAAINHLIGPNFVVRQGDFEIKNAAENLGNLQPQLRFYPVSDQTTNEAAIRHGFGGDLYLVLGQKDENNFYALRVYFKPFIYLIWLGCAMIFVGVIIKICVVGFLNKKPASKDLQDY